MKINFDIHSLDNSIEKFILKKLNTKPPYSYTKISSEELNNIYKEVIDKFPAEKTNNFSFDIIMSIRSDYMRDHIIETHLHVLSKEKSIISDYNNNINLEQLVIKYDAPPLNLLRIIFQKKYKKKLVKIINEMEKLSKREKHELEWGLKHDIYSLPDQSEIQKKASEFEIKIEEFLNLVKIKYKTQLDLTNEQIKLLNKTVNTPDFLILDDFYINDFKVNWIDAKNFYGNKSKFVIRKIKSQTKKYIDTWGPGVIVFNCGFNSQLKFNDIFLIDYNSIKNYIINL